MATFLKNHSYHKSSLVTDWNKVIAQKCNQDKRQSNSTPDSSSGIVSDYHGLSEVSENPKPNSSILLNTQSYMSPKPFQSKELSPKPPFPHPKSSNPQSTQSKMGFRNESAQILPERGVEVGVYQNMCEINKVLQPIEEQLSHRSSSKQGRERGLEEGVVSYGHIARGGSKLKKQVKSLFQPSILPSFIKSSKSDSNSSASTTINTLKGTSSPSHKTSFSPSPPILNTSSTPFFDTLTDSVITQIFSHLLSNHLCKCAMVCKRWYQLIWNPRLWSSIEIHSHKLNPDLAIRSLTRALSIDESRVCLIIQSINLSHCRSLTDRGVYTIAKRCVELKELMVDGCVQVTNIAIFEVVSRCISLQLLSVSGCPYITCISLNPEANLQATAYGKQVYLNHLDMSDCTNVDDSSLHIIATYLSNLMYLYLRRCFKVTDLGVQYVASYCHKLQELSVSDCVKISDMALRDISRLGSSLKYLSIAKCRKVSDTGIRYLAGSCTKIRYLNMRGCVRVSEEGLIYLSTACSKIKSLDVGGCVAAVTDRSLVALSRYCKHLRRLSVRECTGLTDQGVENFAMTAHHLQQINLIDLPLTASSIKALTKYCNDCIIECNVPRFSL